MSLDAPTVARLRTLSADQRQEVREELRLRGSEVDLLLPPVRTGAEAELTVKQSALTQLHDSGDNGAFYHVGAVLEAPSGWDADALQAGWELACARHWELRTAYPRGPDGQRRPRAANAPLPSRWTLSGSLADALAAARELAAAPFSLDDVPVRVGILTNADRTLLAVVAHDVALDRYGLQHVLPKALSEQYGEPAMHVGEVGAWQRGELAAGALEDRRNVALASLGASRPLWTPSRDRSGREMEVFEADADTLRRAVSAVGISAFTVLAGLWAATVATGAGAPDVVLGCCLNGRHRTEFDSVLGNLSNSVLLRLDTRTAQPRLPDEADWDNPAAWQELLHWAASAVPSAIGLADLPYEDLCRSWFDLPPDAGPVADEAVGTRLTVYDSAAEPASEFTVHDLDLGYAKTALELEVSMDSRRVRATLRYRPAVFSETVVTRFARLFKRSWETIAAVD